MAEYDRDAIHQVQQYRKVVLVYEALDKEIDKLIMANGGHTEKCRPKPSRVTVIWRASATMCKTKCARWNRNSRSMTKTATIM